MEVSEPTSTSRRDPRTREELERIFPGRMWVVARVAAEHGWDIAVRPTEQGWALYLTEEHHCIHLFWQPSTKANSHVYPWDLVKASLATRCPNRSGRVNVKNLPEFLANHPDECNPTHDRAPLNQLAQVHCEDHLCPAPKAAVPVRDPLEAPIIATVNVVDVAQHAVKIYGSEEAAAAMLPPGVEFVRNDYRFEMDHAGSTTSFNRGATAEHVADYALRDQRHRFEAGWAPGDPFNPGTGVVAGYVVGQCRHRVAESEWAAGFVKCERCS